MAFSTVSMNSAVCVKAACASGNDRMSNKVVLAQPSASVRNTQTFSSRSFFSGNQSLSAKIQTKKQSASKTSFSVVAETETETVTEYETYEKDLVKPLKVKFARGNDGGAYVIQVASDPDYKEFTIGDKIKRVSASFGEEIWGAENFGQVMFAMKTRSGNVYVEMEKRNGDVSCFEQIEKRSGFKSERAGGNYGAGTQEVQYENYNARQKLAAQREELFNEALGLFREKKYDEALVIFENVVGLEPAGYIGDDMSKVTLIFRVAQYNVACCYSMINQTDAGLEALLSCLKSGFEDYKMIRNDKNLATLREDERFDKMLNRFDEPFINDNAMKVLKGFFGGGKK